MVRTVLAALVVCACSSSSPKPDSPPFVGPSFVGPFAVEFCTSGSPGDPTCPVNHVPLVAMVAAAPSTLDFVAKPDGGVLLVVDAQLDVGADDLYLSGGFIQGAPCDPPTPPVAPAEPWPVVDVQTGPVALADTTSAAVSPGEAQTCLEYQGLGGYDP